MGQKIGGYRINCVTEFYVPLSTLFFQATVLPNISILPE